MKTNGINCPDNQNASQTSELQPAVNHLFNGSAPPDYNIHTWRSDGAAFDLSPQSFGVDAARDHASDEEDDDRFEYSFEMSDDQKQATSELYNLKLDLGFTAGLFYCVYIFSVQSASEMQNV